jgi:hypothetical protein
MNVLNVKTIVCNVNLIQHLLHSIEKSVHNVTIKNLTWIKEFVEIPELTVYPGKWKEENVYNVNTDTD